MKSTWLQTRKRPSKLHMLRPLHNEKTKKVGVGVVARPADY
jgi:hypothetical protein